MEVVHSFLPGLREAIGVGLQLTQVQQNQVAMQQALVDAATPRVATLESDKPDLLDTLQRAGEVPTEAELAPSWAGFVRLQKAEWNVTMNTACHRIAHNQQLAMVAPILPPAYTTDIGTGTSSGHRNDITEGLSVFMLWPGNSPNHKAYQKQSRAYTIVGLGMGAAQEDVVQMLMDNEDVELLETSEQFRGFLAGRTVHRDVGFRWEPQQARAIV